MNKFIERQTWMIPVNMMADAVIIIDRSGTIRHANRHIQSVFGYDPSEITGENLFILLPQSIAERHDNHIDQFFADPFSRPLNKLENLVGQHKDGRIIPLEITVSYFESDDEVVGVAMIRDVTLRKQFEAELEDRNKELDAFAYTVAHDLKSMLGTLFFASRAIAEEAIQAGSTDDMQVYARIISEQTDKMTSVIEGLLLLATVSKDEVVTERITNMGQQVESAVARLDGLISRFDAHIDMTQDFPIVEGYAPWIEEVWLNLISNAVKYGGAHPQVQIGWTALDNNTACFWVKDNGDGLSDELKATLFDEKSRIITPAIDGYGLGLPIVRRIVEKLGGEVGLICPDEGGSQFCFRLPLAE